MITQEFDKQTQLAIAVYEHHTEAINAEIIRITDLFIEAGYSLDSPQAYSLLFDDGLWDPWWNIDNGAESEYSLYVGNHGNTGPEAMYLSTVWCYVLLNKTDNPAKYLPIIAKFLDICVNEL